MRWLIGVSAVVLVVGSAPFWLPNIVVALRVRIFAWVNGDEGIPVPGRRPVWAVARRPTRRAKLAGQLGVADFKRLYAHPAANGRSRGAVLSDLFWYWLAPGPQVHQEHLEPGPRYDDVARTTRAILAGARKDEWEALVARCISGVLDSRGPTTTTSVRLRDLMMPVWAEVYYELVFGQPCPADARELIVANADDVVSALKCTSLRHMGRRDRLTRYLREQIEAGTMPIGLPATLSTEEQAYYLQGTFFNTAVVQMSEAMAHLLMVLATHRDVQDRLRASTEDQGYLDRVIDETLRVYPLFGVAHRITSGQIALEVGQAPIPAGSVLLFNYAAYQHAGLADGDRFDPDRWLRLSPREINHIPFGVSANRPCPARGVAPLGMRVAAREVLRRFALASSAGHSRSLPNRGLALLTPLPDAGRHRARLALMRIGDRWADVWRSLVQLVLGSYMVWDARRQRLCQRYFADTAQPGEGRHPVEHAAR
jgi:cytochrome P450